MASPISPDYKWTPELTLSGLREVTKPADSGSIEASVSASGITDGEDRGGGLFKNYWKVKPQAVFGVDVFDEEDKGPRPFAGGGIRADFGAAISVVGVQLTLTSDVVSKGSVRWGASPGVVMYLEDTARLNFNFNLVPEYSWTEDHGKLSVGGGIGVTFLDI